MNSYNQTALRELKIWQREMLKKPSIASNFSKGIQNKLNALIPKKAHEIVTETIKGMVKAVLFGSELTTGTPLFNVCLYILYIFQLAFSSQKRTREIYQQILEWKNFSNTLPLDINSFDWRTFQQEYRDYIDLAKMLQLVPVIGAAVGAVANYRLMDKLGETAMNTYRLRLIYPTE